jgi:N6-adenosine-specific RNA methylase IME4
MLIDILNTNKTYNIIYADPPWSFKGYDLKKEARYVGNKYDVMSIDEIKNLPIENISCENSILFMWVTYPKLNECFEVIKEWGFEYKTVAFTWVKKNKKSNTNFFGMGRWTRANAEICLLATKGKPKRISASVSQIIESPIEHHSKKPNCTRDKIIELVGDLPRIELFARQEYHGWDSWGNEL